MCKYCNTDLTNKRYACKEYFIHEPFHLADNHTHKTLEANGDNPVLYLREHREVDCWELVCEFADEAGTVVKSPINFCPICGDELISRNNE